MTEYNHYFYKRPNGTIRVTIKGKVDGDEINTSTTFTPDPRLSEEDNRKAATTLANNFALAVAANHRAAKEGKDPTFGEYFHGPYQKNGAVYFAPTTFDFYIKTIEKHFLDPFENVKVKDMCNARVQQVINALALKANENEDLDELDDPIVIKPQTVKRYVTALRSVINMAVEDGSVAENPIVGSLHYRRPEAVNVVTFDEVDFRAIINDLEDKLVSPYRKLTRNDVMVAICMLAGLRRGELVGLQWGDLINLCEDSLERVQINISRAAYKVAESDQKKGATKSYRSTRMFTIPHLLARVLWAWKQLCAEEHGFVDDDCFVISNEFGEMVSIYSPTKWFKDYLEEHALKNVKLHSLRHTFASALLDAGMDIYTIRDLMGHKDLSTTEMYLKSYKMRKGSLMSVFNTYASSKLAGSEVEDDEDED